MIRLGGGWYTAQATHHSLASSLTSGLNSNLASFPANKKQLAHSHTPSSIPTPWKLLSLPQLTGHSWASPTYQLGKRARRGERVGQRKRWGIREREIERVPISLLSSPRLFSNAYFTPALSPLLSNSLYGVLSWEPHPIN